MLLLPNVFLTRSLQCLHVGHVVGRVLVVIWWRPLGIRGFRCQLASAQRKRKFDGAIVVVERHRPVVLLRRRLGYGRSDTVVGRFRPCNGGGDGRVDGFGSSESRRWGNGRGSIDFLEVLPGCDLLFVPFLLCLILCVLFWSFLGRYPL
jgi:hypothetical protein